MTTIPYETESAIFTFNRNDVQECVNRIISEHQVQEASDLLTLITQSQEPEIKIPKQKSHRSRKESFWRERTTEGGCLQEHLPAQKKESVHVRGRGARVPAGTRFDLDNHLEDVRDLRGFCEEGD